MRVLLTAPEGVAKALAENSSLALPIREHGKLKSVERLEIYANMYFYRLLDSLKEDFPALLIYLGKDQFHNLVTDYLIEFPSTHYSLRYVGVHMEGFITKSSLVDTSPMLVDLVKLEWALLDLFDAEDSKPLTLNDLQSLSPEDWSTLSLKSIPAFKIIECSWPVDLIRQELLNDGISNSNVAETSPFHLLIWRKDLQMTYRRALSHEVDFLKILQENTSFEKLCEEAISLTDTDSAIPIIQRMMSQWATDQLLQLSI